MTEHTNRIGLLSLSRLIPERNRTQGLPLCFIWLVITFPVVVAGHGIRWVCGTSGVSKLYDYVETYSAPLSPSSRRETWDESVTADEVMVGGSSRSLLYKIFLHRLFFPHKKAVDPQLLINPVSHCSSIIITTKMTAAMIIILRRNEPIGWASPAVHSTAETPDCHAEFSGRLVNCIFPPAQATSDKWSEVRCTEEQWACYHSAIGGRTTNCNRP